MVDMDLRSWGRGEDEQNTLYDILKGENRMISGIQPWGMEIVEEMINIKYGLE